MSSVSQPTISFFLFFFKPPWMSSKPKADAKPAQHGELPCRPSPNHCCSCREAANLVKRQLFWKLLQDKTTPSLTEIWGSWLWSEKFSEKLPEEIPLGAVPQCRDLLSSFACGKAKLFSAEDLRPLLISSVLATQVAVNGHNVSQIIKMLHFKKRNNFKLFPHGHAYSG